MLYVVGILLAAILTLGGVASCEHKKVQALETQIEANKIEAERLLTQAKAQGKADAIASQKDFEDALKTLSDRNKYYAGKLRDPGRTGSCPSPGSPANVPADAPTGSELSDEAGSFLRGEADRADLAATYAEKCRVHATKPTIRSQVEALRSQP